MKRIIMAICLVILLVGLLPIPVQGAGATTASITATNARNYTIYGSHQWDFLTATNADVADDISPNTNGTRVGWTGLNTSAWMTPYASILEFDLSSVVGNDITSATIKMYCSSKTDTSVLSSNFFFAMYNTDGGLDNAVGVADWDTMLDVYAGERLSNVYQYTDVNPNAYFSFVLSAYGLDNIRTGNKIFFFLATTNHAQGVPFAWEQNKGMQIDWAAQNSANPPKLEVVYTSEAVARTVTIPANAAVDNTTDGTEVCDNITLGTPRYMYADEDLYFLVNGDSGAAIDLQLEDTAGAVIQGLLHTDSIRTDNDYDYTISTLAATTDTICRLRETNSGEVSEWISIKPAPSATMPNLSVMCGSTAYPPYRNQMTTWAVYTDDIMVVNWKTNINGASELGNYSLALYPQGDNTTSLYDSTLATILGTMGGTVGNQQALGHWRYMLFTPDRDSLDDYGGLIQDLNLDYTTLKRGLICPAIHAADGSWLTTTHSTYWYLKDDLQAMSVKLAKTTYKANEPITAVITVGGDCNIELRLPSVSVKYLNSSAVAVTNEKAYSYSEGSTSLGLAGISGAGNYIVQLRFNGSTNYNHYVWLDVTVTSQQFTGGTSGGSGGGFTEDMGTRIKQWVRDYGMDDEAGHWVIMLALMALMVGIFWKVKILAVVMPLGVLAIAMVINWVNPAIVVLLALGAGLTLWALFRKKANGTQAGG